LLHTVALEPTEIPNRYVVCDVNPLHPNNKVKVTKENPSGTPKSPKSTKWYTNQVKAFEKANKGKTIIDQDKYDKMVVMSKIFHANPVVKRLFSRNSGREIALVWEDKATGLLCKARLDSFSDDEMPTIGDLKKTTNADDQWHDGMPPFDYTINKYNYDLQSAFYVDGIKTLTGKSANFLMIAVEDKAPYGLRVGDMTQ